MKFAVKELTPEYEQFVRGITNPNGGHNSGAQSLPQDRLAKVWGWFHGNTGFVIMWRWQSGRQDARVHLDHPNPSPEALAKQAAMIEEFKPLLEECSDA